MIIKTTTSNHREKLCLPQQKIEGCKFNRQLMGKVGRRTKELRVVDDVPDVVELESPAIVVEIEHYVFFSSCLNLLGI